MSNTVKVLQKGAFHLEAGKAGVGQSPGWGQANSAASLGTNDAYPWLSWPRGKNINHAVDNSIIGNAFKDIPRKVGEHVEKPISMYSRFEGMEALYYWMFGFANSVLPVVCFVVDTPSVEPLAGALYDDTDDNTFTFLRKETSGSTVYYVFKAEDSASPALATGDLTKASGTGDATLSFTAHSTVLYEHLFELDELGRSYVPYPAAEQITGYSAGDKKNRMATIGTKMGTNDFRYKNAMCSSFGFRSNAGQLGETFAEFIAHDEERGSYNSAGWTYPSTRISNDNIVAHHQFTVQVGPSEAALTALGVTAFETGCQIPLEVMQDTLSGTHISEPTIEGKYDLALGMTLSRYSAETFQNYRDSWSNVVARIAGNYGYMMQELLYNDLIVGEAGPDESDVAKEPLVLYTGYNSNNNWSNWLHGNSLLQNGPMVLRVRTTESQNQMFAN